MQKLKWVLTGTLVILVVMVGQFEDLLKTEILTLITSPFSLPVISHELSLSLFNNSGRITNLVFRVLYCCLCVFTVHSLFYNYKITKLAIGFYLAVLVLVFLLYGISVSMNIQPLHTIAFRIDTLLISPMAIIIFIPALTLSTRTQK
ncbi:XrtX-associated membrane protein [Pontibacter sp. MBLB2868]|uniref:XrtX-associated membrane protein n=1 Tax=Pontibacter sp. MBLB2868 TaxID=3451555 RepID=UPI003F74C1CD